MYNVSLCSTIFQILLIVWLLRVHKTGVEKIISVYQTSFCRGS